MDPKEIEVRALLSTWIELAKIKKNPPAINNLLHLEDVVIGSLKSSRTKSAKKRAAEIINEMEMKSADRVKEKVIKIKNYFLDNGLVP